VNVQLSQFFRRGVIRPLDDDAVQQLAAFRIDTPIRVEWLPIMNDDEFARIWEAGVLQRINEACGVDISDYEEVELPANRIESALRAVRYDAGNRDSIGKFIQSLDGLLSDAVATNKNVYFIF